MPFEDYARSYIVNALERTPPEIAKDVYVVSLYAEPDGVARDPTLVVGFNTETQVAETTDRASDVDEARWNFAFWLQNELGVLGDRERDPEGAALRDQWVQAHGLWYSDEDEDDDFEAAMEKAERIAMLFDELVISLVQQIHADGSLVRIFGRPVPVLIHELEYYDEIAEKNVRANPDGLADAFARWIDQM
jgi:hypothetical protein